MNFTDALKDLIEGKHVRRLCWPVETCVAKLKPGILKLDDIKDPYLRCYAQANGGQINVHDHYYLQYSRFSMKGGWFPVQDDLDAEDWTIADHDTYFPPKVPGYEWVIESMMDIRNRATCKTTRLAIETTIESFVKHIAFFRNQCQLASEENIP